MIEKTIYRRGKTHFAELAGYKDDMLYIGFFDDKKNIQGDFNISFIDVANDITPQLNVFNDSWKALSEMPELINYLSESDGMKKSIDDIHSDIVKLGYKDTTSYNPEYDNSDIKRMEKARDELSDKLSELTDQIKRATDG